MTMYDNYSGSSGFSPYEVEVFKRTKQSAEQGNTDSMWRLALAYEHGRGTATDMAKAVYWYEKGAEAGNAECIHNLAVEYINGRYLQKDYRKGFELASKAAALGSGFAMRTLGACYQFGYGCTGNMKKALEWYRKASQIIYDPELNEKVEHLEMMARYDVHFGDDYAGTPENNGVDSADNSFSAGKENTSRESDEERQAIIREKLKEQIVDYLSDGMSRTIQEVVKGINSDGVSENEVRSALTQLKLEGLAVRQEVDRIAYYRLNAGVSHYDSSVKIAQLKRAFEKKNRPMTQEMLKELIVDYLSDGVMHTIQEVAEGINSDGVSVNEVRAALTQLKFAGKVTRSVVDGTAYYILGSW